MITYSLLSNVQKLFGLSYRACKIGLFYPDTFLDLLGDVRKNGRCMVPEQWPEERRHGSKQEQNEASTLVHGPNAIAGSRKKKPCSRFPALGSHGFGKMREDREKARVSSTDIEVRARL
jgi:hypothetical protein